MLSRSYTITINDLPNGKTNIQRTNTGLSIFELKGILHFIKLDIEAEYAATIKEGRLAISRKVIDKKGKSREINTK